MGHPGNKGSRVVFLGDTNLLFSTGFSRMNERQIALWDVVSSLLFKYPLVLSSLYLFAFVE